MTQYPSNNIFIRHAFVVLFLFLSIVTKAQDPSYSQYNLNQLYYNPAYTGYHGGYQITATYRTLWPNVRGKTFPQGPLATYHAFFDCFVGRNYYHAGIGAFAMEDMEGEGHLKTSTFGISYAQHLPTFGGYKSDLSPRLKLSLGFKAYVSSIFIDWDKLVFTDQLNLDYGITPGANSTFNHTGTYRKFVGDIDAGLLLLNNFMGQGKWYNEVGFSMAHILAPAVSLTGSTEDNIRLPRKYLVSYRSTVDIAKGKLFMGPTILFENQKNFFELNTGLDFFLKVGKDSRVIPLALSVMNRLSIVQGKTNTSAIIIGISHKGLLGRKNPPVYTIGFAADFPYMGLGMQTAGAYELSIGIIIPQKGGNGFSQCPYTTFDHAKQMNQYYKPKVKNR